MNKEKSFTFGLALVLGLAAGHVQADQTQPIKPDQTKLAPASNVQNISEIKSNLKLGQKLYVNTKAANLRGAPSRSGPLLGTLVQGDQVQILEITSDQNEYIKVKIISTAVSESKALTSAYISLTLLSQSQETASNSDDGAPQENSKYFVIQNLATEKTRVYKRCLTAPGCSHEMIFETEMVIGKPEEGPGLKTRVGKGLIADWIKFYGNDHYPPWYMPTDEQGNGKLRIPAPGNLGVLKSLEWFNKDYMDSEYKNVSQPMKGAFGWYMAKLYPEDAVDYQWLHGTLGWGADGGKAIDVTRGVVANLVSNPGSHGCTRLENQAIAFMRSFLPIGTPIYRIYAREAMAQAPVLKKKWKFIFPEYVRVDQKEPGQWNWILTKMGAQKSMGLTADAGKVKEAGLADNAAQVIEKGTYVYDRTPDAQGIDFSKEEFSGKSGDRYLLANEDTDNLHLFVGYFLVDVGLLDHYQHPNDRSIIIGGMPEFRNSVPDYLTYQGSNQYYIPEPIVKPRNSSGM